jgi:hypothetical protein
MSSGKFRKKKVIVLLTMIGRTMLILAVLTMMIADTGAAEKIVINHRNWDPSGSDVKILDRIRTLKIIHLERSIGANIASGLRRLRDDDPTRYYLNMTHAPIDPNSMDLPGYGYNFISKVQGYEKPRPVDAFKDTYYFSQKIRSADEYGEDWGNILNIVEFNVGWTGIKRHTNVDSFFVYYTTKIESLAIEYPNCKFIFYTCCIKTRKDCDTENSKMDQIARHEFNKKLRAYVDRNGGYLFDIADLQAHDEKGILQTFEYNGADSPVLWHVPENEKCDGWGDSTSHLNAKGQERMALAKWRLWAAIIQKDLSVEH